MLTILNLTFELDGATVFCGTGAQPQQANIRLRVFSKFLSTQAIAAWSKGVCQLATLSLLLSIAYFPITVVVIR